jgi:type IV secretory pathway VirB10-like protein
VEGVAGLESTVSASSSTLLADMGDAEKLSAAVTEAETSVVVEIPKSPPPPSPSPPSPPPPPPPPPPVTAQPLPSATPSNYTQVIEGDSGSQGTSPAKSGAARFGGSGRFVATLAALAAFAV